MIFERFVAENGYGPNYIGHVTGFEPYGDALDFYSYAAYRRLRTGNAGELTGRKLVGFDSEHDEVYVVVCPD